MNRRQHEGVVMSRSAYLTHRPTRTGRNLWSARIHTLLKLVIAESQRNIVRNVQKF